MAKMRVVMGFGGAIVLGALLVPASVALLAVTGALSSDATSEPPGWETDLGRRALSASLRRRADRLTSPLRPDDEAALLKGMSLYRVNCAGCHGEPARASAWGAQGFYPRVPQFWQDEVEIRPEEAFVAIRDGIRYSGMGAWRGLMEEPDMWRVATFVSRIRRLPPQTRFRWGHEEDTAGTQ